MEEEENKKVPLDVKVFDRRDAFTAREEEIEVPELNALMEVEKGQVVIVRVRQLSLDEYMRITSEINDQQRNLIEGVVEAAVDKEFVRDEVIEALKGMSPTLKHSIKVVKVGVIAPKLKESDIIWLSKMFPFVINRISNRIVSLTEQGAIKKNSQN